MFLFVALQVASAVPPSASLKISQQVYAACLTKGAGQLEPSGEAAGEIADVAVSRCEWLLPVVYDDAIAVFRASPEVKSFEETGKSYANYEQQKPALMAKFRSAGRVRAMAAVMDARATKNKR